jgi:hypothetical protein
MHLYAMHSYIHSFMFLFIMLMDETFFHQGLSPFSSNPFAKWVGLSPTGDFLPARHFFVYHGARGR